MSNLRFEELKLKKVKDFTDFSIRSINEALQAKKISPVDVANVSIENYHSKESLIHAWDVFSPEKMMEAAKESEAYLRNHAPRPLESVPIGVKDIINTADYPTEMGSLLWKGFTPGNDGRVVYNVKRQGGIIPGKTVTAEFAVHALGKTLNPHCPKRNPGTSSSGSAAAVASGVVPAALGTQTAASIIRPASFCGVYGCKPSFGLIPRTGMLKTTDSLDTVGFFTSHLEDLEIMFDATRVHGWNYPFSHLALIDSARQRRSADRPWRVVFARTHTWNEAERYAQEAIENWIKDLSNVEGVELVDIELPKAMSRSHEIHNTIYCKTLEYYFREEYKKSEFVSSLLNQMIEDGKKITLRDYQQAWSDQELLRSLMDDFFLSCDILISLSTAGEAPFREDVEKPDPALMWNLTHLPVVSAPVFTSPSGLPFGLQVAARHYNDRLLFNFLRFLKEREMVPSGTFPILNFE